MRIHYLMPTLTEAQRDRLATNVARIRDRIATAAEKSGRDPGAITLVAVTKGRPPELIPELAELGIAVVGENRPEELARKRDAFAALPLAWHMIGHYQRRKIPKTLRHIDMVHSAHSLELLATLDAKVAATRPEALDVLVQVNVAGDPRKQGFAPKDVADVCDIVDAMPSLRLRGLMTMAPLEADERSLHEIFGALRILRDAYGPERLPELSMGMSSDFEIAISEGATMVRVGSALFEGVDDRR